MTGSTDIGISVGSSRVEDSRKTGTSIRWHGLKEGVSPEDLDKGLKELVDSFYADGRYEPKRKQPELAFYDNQEIKFRFTGKAKELDEDNLGVVIKTKTSPNWRKVFEYSLDVELVHQYDLDKVYDVIADRVREFAVKYTTFIGHPECNE